MNIPFEYDPEDPYDWPEEKVYDRPWSEDLEDPEPPDGWDLPAQWRTP